MTYCHRGWAYVFCEAWPLAIKDFERAIRLDPQNGDACNGLGYASIKVGKAVAAVENAEAALRRPPHDVEMMFNIACIFALASGAAQAGESEDRRDHQAWVTKHRDRALEVLQQTLDRLPDAERPSFWRNRVRTDPDLGPIRHCPGFTALEAKYSEPGE
jgi:tetratricopeptide (TPR) repeat protein